MIQDRHEWTTVLFAMIVAATTCAATGNAIADDAVLEIKGSCPGQVRISWQEAIPNRGFGLVWGLERGKTNIPNGFPCSGTVMGIIGRVQEIDRFRTRATGSGFLAGRTNAKFCGGVIQMVIFDPGPCQLSNVADVPE